MKAKLTIICLLIATVSFAQIKKPVKPKAKLQASVTPAKVTAAEEPVKVDTLELVKEKAQKWFKENYVEHSFKDPYSYELLKTVVKPVPLYQKLIEDTFALGTTINVETIVHCDSTKYTSFKTYKDNVEEYEKKLSKKNAKVSELTKSMYEQELKHLNEERAKAEVAKKKIAIAQAEVDAIKERLKTMSDSEKQSVGYYKVFIDCHANNSYGGKVLGKYGFKYTFDKGGYDVDSYSTE